MVCYIMCCADICRGVMRCVVMVCDGMVCRAVLSYASGGAGMCCYVVVCAVLLWYAMYYVVIRCGCYGMRCY